MFRGESLDILSREIDIPAERLTKWKEAFIKGTCSLETQFPKQEVDLPPNFQKTY
jgi:hypothetical protein